MRIVWFFCICLTIVVGGIIVPEGCRRNTYDMGWRRVKVFKDEITQVRSQLEAFKIKHGRYPTNDEGLSVLDNFAGRFRMPIPDYFLTGDKRRLTASVFDFMAEHNKLPASAADVNSVLHNALEDWRWPSGPMLEYEVAVTDEYRWVCVFSDAGLLDAGGVPYVYENRSGMDKAMFAHSLAYTGGDKPWSIKLSPDVYVYSVPGFSIWKRNVEFRRNTLLMIMVPVGLLVLFVALYRRARRRSADKSGLSVDGYIILGLSLLLAMFAGLALSPTCYASGVIWRCPDRASLTQRLDLLKKYHEKGVISDATFAKAKEAMEAEIANTPP